jgi:holo-[acyl-carrier protein] synthase
MDIVEAADVRAALDTYGDRYVRRLLSDRERASLPTSRERQVPVLARAFAAKEAILKSLGPGIDTVAMTSVECRPTPLAEWHVVLHADARTLAWRNGVTAVAVTVTSTRECAAAIALATTN